MSDASALYPLEIILRGTPISLQSKSAKHRERWKAQVTEAARERQRETDDLGFLDDRPLAVTIFYFPLNPMAGDIDNIVKPIMDALKTIAYLDDRVVERLIVQKFEPDGGWVFLARSDRLADAMEAGPPVLYVRVDDHLKWRQVP